MSANKLWWRIHTANLAQEILRNPGTSIMRIPLQIMLDLLSRVGERAIDLDDPQLNELMARLTIYSVADPESADYNVELTERLLATGGCTLASLLTEKVAR